MLFTADVSSAASLPAQRDPDQKLLQRQLFWRPRPVTDDLRRLRPALSATLLLLTGLPHALSRWLAPRGCTRQSADNGSVSNKKRRSVYAGLLFGYFPSGTVVVAK